MIREIATEKLDKLPKYARDYIARLERTVNELERELALNSGPAKSRITGGHERPFNVRDDHSLRFRLDSNFRDEEWIEVRLHATDSRRPEFLDALRVYASRFVGVQPRSSNVIEVKVER